MESEHLGTEVKGMESVCQDERGTSAVSGEVKAAGILCREADAATAVLERSHGTAAARREARKPGTVCIAYANGCPRSRMAAARLFPYFAVNGWKLEQDFGKADLVLVSTCGVNQRAERKSIRLLSIADKKRRPDSRFVVLGCLAGINKEALLKKFKATVIAPTALADLDEVTEARVKLCKIREPNLVEPVIDKSQKSFSILDRAISEFEPSRVFLHRMLDCLKPKKSRCIKEDAYSIRILAGCLGECTYCAIRFAEGPLVSKPMDAILAEFNIGLARGNRNFCLIGTDVGAYGQDIGTDIVELLRNLLTRRQAYVIHLPEFHPRWLVRYRPDLMDIFAGARDKIGSIILPIESGSDRVLQRMQRRYTAAEAKECLLDLREYLPGVGIFTHVLVGFPGESDDDFDQTVRLLKEAPFDEIAVYKYEGRPRIEAEQMPDKVPDAVKHARVCRLLKEFPGIARVAL